jgi:tetratricopeptide (TPR) repeat protein
MALDPSLAEVHYSQGAFVFVFEPRWQEAEVHFRRAIAINPRMAIAHAYLGMMASCERRHDNAIAHADRACELDPLAGVIMYIASSIYTDAGRFEQAERLARCALELQPESPAGIRSLNIALMGQERHEEAVAVAERVVAFSRMPMYVGLLGLSYARAGRIEPARLLLAELAERKDRGEYVGPNGALAINVGLGDVGGIRTGLQECIADRTPILALRLVSGVFLDPYRADAEVDRLYGALYRGD